MKALYFLIFSLAILFHPFSYCFQDTWFSRFVKHDLALEDGNGHIYDFSRNDYLSWGESYLLHSYLNAYKVTQDTIWLDKFLSHSTVVINRMTDIDSDGVLGWPISRYAQNVVKNPSFTQFTQPTQYQRIYTWNFENESFSSSNDVHKWVRFQANENMVFIGEEGVGGSSSIVIDADAIDWRAAEFFLYDYFPSQLYFFSCDVRSISGEAKPIVDVRLHSRNIIKRQRVNVNESSSTWRESGVFFYAPKSSGDKIILRLQTSSSEVQGKVSFDNCTLSKVNNADLLAWEMWQSSNKTVKVGNGTVEIKTDAGYGFQVLQTSLNNDFSTNDYVPNRRYQVRFKGKASSVLSGGRVHIFDWTDYNTLATYDFTSLDWEDYKFDFKTPDTLGHNIQIRLTHTNWDVPEQSVWFEHVSVQQFSEYMIDDAMILYPLSKFANLIKSTPSLHEKYLSYADSFISLAEQSVQKWEGSWIETAHYGTFLATDDGAMRAYAGCALPLNQVAVPGSIYIELFKYTDNGLYFSRAEKIANNFFNYFNQTPSGEYVWNYYENLFIDDVPLHCQKAQVVEDISHANLDVDFMLNAYNAGIKFDKDDIRSILNTFINLMWNQSYTTPDVSSRVNGSDDVIAGEYLWWWGELSAFDIKVLFIIQSMWHEANIHEIDKSGPIDPDTGKWVAQGWKILMKSSLSYWYDKYNNIRNGDFGNPVLGSHWLLWQSTNESARVNSLGALEITSSDKWQVVQQDLEYVPDQQYRVFFNAKTSPGARFYVQIYDWVGDKVIATLVGSSDVWKEYELTYTAPSNTGRRISIRLMPLDINNLKHKVEFDNVIIGKAFSNTNQ